MCLFVCAASAVAIDSTEKKQEKRGVLGVGLAGGLVAPPLGIGHAGLVGPGIIGSGYPAGIVGSGYGLGLSHGLGPYGLAHGPIGLAHGPIGLSHSSLGLAHAPIGLSHGLGPYGLAHGPIGLSTASYGLGAPLNLGLAHSSYVGAPLGISHAPIGLSHASLGLSHGLYGGSTIIH